MKALEKYQVKIILACIIAAAIVLRFHKLSLESLWLDELHTILEANPNETWAGFFDLLRCCDPHPPLFFFLERITFALLGYTEENARVIPALAGVGSVWAMYLLGKEILNERLGLISAAITCVNYFNIYYSQEARGYILLWFFTILSTAFFIRLVKRLDRKTAIWYIISTVLLLYTHYFSLFVIMSQMLLFFIFWWADKGSRKKMFITFLVVELIILACYSPWLPWLKRVSETPAFWIQQPNSAFYADYFREYFGFTSFLYPFLYIALILFFVRVFTAKAELRDVKNNPEVLSALVVLVTVFVVYGVTYVRSVMSVPMIISRYTVVVIPALMLAIAYGLHMISSPVLRNIVVGTFLFLSVFDIIYAKKFYRDMQKQQFREVSQFVTNENNRVALFNQVAPWQQGYYLDKFGYKGPVMSGKKEDVVDSILAGTNPDYAIDTFWLVGVHGDPYLEQGKRGQLEQVFHVANHRAFIDTWAELWIRKADTSTVGR